MATAGTFGVIAPNVREPTAAPLVPRHPAPSLDPEPAAIGPELWRAVQAAHTMGTSANQSLSHQHKGSSKSTVLLRLAR